MTRSTIRLFCVAVLTLVLSPLAAQTAPLDGFDAWVTSGMKDWHIPGMSVAVVKDGRVVHAKGYGVRELGRPDAVDEHTLFAIGSTTKAMTAALLGMLVDEKKLNWDDPVSKYLPWFQLKDPYVTRELTVRDLLTHRAGLPNTDYLWVGQSNSTAEILRRMRLVDPAYSFRSGYIYQNIMYVVAGAVIEAAGGKPWTEMIQTRIFDPLGMRDTVPLLSAAKGRANVASPHDEVRGKVQVVENSSVDSVAPAGSVWSSAADMAKWVQFLLDGGRTPDGRRLLSEKSVAEMLKPQTISADMYPALALVKPHWITYGFGWFQIDYRGRAVDFHTGSITGMVAIHGLIPDERLGVYALANLDHSELRHAVMYTVFDRYAPTIPGGRTAADRDWNHDLLKLYGDLQKQAEGMRQKQEAQRVMGTSPSLALEKYAGTYSDPLRGQVEITAAGGGLRLRYGTRLDGVLEHWNYDTFRAKWSADWMEPALVTFSLDAQGRAVTLRFRGGTFARQRE